MSVPESTGAAGRKSPGGASGLLFVAFFALLLVLQWRGLDQPPVWDSATGLFPAAITLAESGFDLPDLLRQPGWRQGGPNRHALSVVAWATAAVIRAVGDGPALFPLLHALHLAVAALLLVGSVAYARPVLGRPQALALGVVVLLIPLFRTQTGMMYTELPLACATIFALLEASRDRFGRALAWSVVACLCKESGVIVPAVLASAALLEERPARERARRAGLLAIAPLAAVIAQVVLAFPYEHSTGFTAMPYLSFLVAGVWFYLVHVPDLLVLLLAGVAAGALDARRHGRALTADPRRRRDEAASTADHRLALALLLVVGFLVFYLVLPLAHVEFYVLPRYYVQILPLLVLLVAGGCRRRLGPAAAGTFLLALALFSLANAGGRFYPPVPTNQFPIAARSSEYRDLLAAQRRVIEAAAATAPNVPVYAGLPEYYAMSQPRLGYVKRRHPGLRLLVAGAPMPREFCMIENHPMLGGMEIDAVLRSVRRDPGLVVTVREFEQGPYTTRLYHVAPRPGPAPKRTR